MPELSFEDIKRRFLDVKQYQKDGVRALHKPLLQLLALSQLVKSASSELGFQEAEPLFKQLMLDYGAPSSRRKLEHPFRYMRTDGLWEVHPKISEGGWKLAELRQSSGRFPVDVETRIANEPNGADILAASIARHHLPDSLALELLERLGFTTLLKDATQLDITQTGRRRRAGWRDEILNAWNRMCAFCGYHGALGHAAVGLDAAHIRWFNLGGPDNLDNGLSLCALDHRLFDRGALGLSDDLSIKVSPMFTTATPAGNRILELHGRRLTLRAGIAAPHDDYLEWHNIQVFKST